MSPKRFAWALAAVVLATFALHADRAADPSSRYQSADERSYGRLAISIADKRSYGDARMRDPLHWPPGAPMVFAAAHKLFPSPGSVESRDIPAAYWALAIASTLTTLFVALLAAVIAGPWAGLIAGALVGSYPPLLVFTGSQLSEPLGGMWLAAGMLALALASRNGRWWLYAGAGSLFGLAVLTRADLLPAVALLPLLLLAWQRRLPGAVALGAGAVVAIAPWSAYASQEAGAFVPVTRGGASAFFVGTYLPGGGNTVGMKRALADEVQARNPKYRGKSPLAVPASEVLAVIADRHPGLDENAALAKETRANLRRYALGDPLEFGLMTLDKGVQRMWSRYSRGGVRVAATPVLRTWHVLLVIVGFAGLLCGLRARPHFVFAAILLVALTSTAVHMLAVSQARYNAPLMPVVVAGGVAGAVLVIRALRAPPPAAAGTAASDRLRPGAVPAKIGR